MNILNGIENFRVGNERAKDEISGKRKEVSGMFCYCAKCANIKKTGEKNGENVVCEICGTPMQPVPSEYLMAGGNFFKSQEVRQNFLSAVRAADTYDAEIGESRDEIKQTIEAEKQQHIQEMNRKLEQEQFRMTCPVCGGHSVQKISSVGKYAKIGAFGILGADDLGKRWKCKICGAKF